MPMCGFSKIMLDGLGVYHQGLAEAVIKKSKKNNITVEEAIMWELKEMDTFLKELVVLGNEINKQKLMGIARYSKAFYLGALKKSKEKNIAIEEAMKSENEMTKGFLFEIDNYYYEYLEGKKENPMKELISWIGQEKK